MEGQDPSASPRSPHRQRRRLSHQSDMPNVHHPPYGPAAAAFAHHQQLINSNPSGNFSYPPMPTPFFQPPPSMMQPPPYSQSTTPHRAHSIDSTPFFENEQQSHYSYPFRAPIEQDVKPPLSPYLQTSSTLPLATTSSSSESIATIERLPHPKVERLSHSPTPPEIPQTTGKNTIHYLKLILFRNSNDKTNIYAAAITFGCMLSNHSNDTSKKRRKDDLLFGLDRKGRSCR